MLFPEAGINLSVPEFFAAPVLLPKACFFYKICGETVSCNPGAAGCQVKLF